MSSSRRSSFSMGSSSGMSLSGGGVQSRRMSSGAIVSTGGYGSRMSSGAIVSTGGYGSRMSSGSIVSTGGYGARMSRGGSPSVYGGAGGFGTRISRSVFDVSPGNMMSYGFAVGGNEKSTMQNLNDRLGSYLDKVRTLEAANRRLELQIKEFYEKKAPVYGKDLTVFFGTISDLRLQLLRKFKENHLMILQVDNARLAADDFKMKFETELSMRTAVEADLTRMRGVLGSLSLARSDLEVQIEGLKEELVYIKRNHEEEMLVARAQQGGSVNVEVDCAEAVDLNKVITEIREQYEGMVHKNQCEVEKWFQNKVEALQTHIVSSTTEVKTYQSEVNDLRRTQQSMEIELQAQLSTKQCVEQSVAEVSARYSLQLSQMQQRINGLEVELQQLGGSIQTQAADYQLLLDIKMRLELEIAEYRRLLEGEGHHRGVIISTSTRKVADVKVKKEVKKKVEVVEEYKPCIERRVRTIVEEIVDGEVVSSTQESQMESIQTSSRRGSKY